MMTLKEARRRWASRRRQYVVGYIASVNTLYGRKRGWASHDCTDPMTLREAQAFLKQMPDPGAAIFKLAVVAVGGGAKA
jgi:hypothetical protein